MLLELETRTQPALLGLSVSAVIPVEPVQPLIAAVNVAAPELIAVTPAPAAVNATVNSPVPALSAPAEAPGLTVVAPIASPIGQVAEVLAPPPVDVATNPLTVATPVTPPAAADGLARAAEAILAQGPVSVPSVPNPPSSVVPPMSIPAVPNARSGVIPPSAEVPTTPVTPSVPSTPAALGTGTQTPTDTTPITSPVAATTTPTTATPTTVSGLTGVPLTPTPAATPATTATAVATTPFVIVPQTALNGGQVTGGTGGAEFAPGAIGGVPTTAVPPQPGLDATGVPAGVAVAEVNPVTEVPPILGGDNPAEPAPAPVPAEKAEEAPALTTRLPAIFAATAAVLYGLWHWRRRAVTPDRQVLHLAGRRTAGRA